MAEQFRPPPSKRIDAGANPAGGTFGGETGRGAGTRLNRAGRPRAAGEHDLSSPPFFRRVKPRSPVIGWKPFRAARPVGQDHCSPPFLLGSESAEVRTLFRKQLDRHCRLRRKTSALRQFPRVAQKQSNRPITDRPRSVTVREDHFGGLIPKVGSRVANACGDSVAEGRDLNPPPLPGRLKVGRRSLKPRMHVRVMPRQPISFSASIGSDAAVS